MFSISETSKQIGLLLNVIRMQTEAEKAETARQALLAQGTGTSTLPCSSAPRTVEVEQVSEYDGPKLYYLFGPMKKGYSLKFSTEFFTSDDSPSIDKKQLIEVAIQIFGIIPGEEVVINAVEENVHYVMDDITQVALEERFSELGWECCEESELVETGEKE